jgi:hypothetical protein
MHELSIVTELSFRTAIASIGQTFSQALQAVHFSVTLGRHPVDLNNFRNSGTSCHFLKLTSPLQQHGQQKHISKYFSLFSAGIPFAIDSISDHAQMPTRPYPEARSR